MEKKRYGPITFKLFVKCLKKFHSRIDARDEDYNEIPMDYTYFLEQCCFDLFLISNASAHLCNKLQLLDDINNLIELHHHPEQIKGTYETILTLLDVFPK